MRYMPPRTDLTSLQFLKLIMRKGEQDSEESRFIQTYQTRVEELTGQYERILHEHLESTAERKEIARERSELADRMATYTRDYLATLKRYINREQHPKSLLVLFGISSQGNLPVMKTEEEKLHYTELLLEGAATLEAQGYGVVTCPDVDQVRAALAPVLDIIPRSHRAVERSTNSQIQLEQIRIESGDLIQSIVTGLRAQVSHLEPAKQRQLLKTFGVTFKPHKPQIEDEEPEELYLEPDAATDADEMTTDKPSDVSSPDPNEGK